MNSITVNDIEFIIKRNVISYVRSHEGKWDIKTSDNLSEILTENKYLIIDRDNDASNAFGHWILESYIFVMHYFKLKKEVPNLKLLLKDKRDFKSIFLKYLGINTSDIEYSLEINNTCIFPPYFDLGSSNTLSKWHSKLIKDFMSLFHNGDIEKTIPIVFLPRQTKENYVNNNRTYDTRDIERYITELDSSNVILNTDLITDLNEQINTIQRAHIVVVTDGSPALINSIFSNNSKYIILGKIHFGSNYEIVKEVINTSETEYNNKIIFSNSCSLNDFIEALNS